MSPAWSMIIYALYLSAAIGAVLLCLWQAANNTAKAPAMKASTVALAISAAWAFSVIGLGQYFILSELLFSAAYYAWLYLLYSLFAHDNRDKSLGPIRPVVLALALVELMQMAMMIASTQYVGQEDAQILILRFAITFRLLFCIGALVLVHNLYVGAAQEARQSLRWPAAAMAALWLYDLNFYTIAYLIEGLPVMLAELRSLALATAVVLLAIGSVRNESEMQFRPSRSFAFQSFSLLIIGTYLVIMVVVAQGIAYAGNDYGPYMQTGFVLVASAVALAVIPSPKMRRWLRVMVSKHLFQHRYDYRNEWLRFTDTIGRAGPQAPPLPERIVQALADVTDSPSGLLLTPHEEGGVSLAARWQWHSIDVPGEALTVHGASFFEESQFILDLDDIRGGQEEAIPDSAYPQWLLEDDNAWALIPLLHYERLVGIVVLARPPMARRLDWEDFDLLRVVGRQLASYLAEQASQDALGEAQRFDEFNRRIAFVMHDIKNLASQLSLLAGNAEKHADKPEFRADMILTLRNSTDKLQALLDRLGRYGAQGTNQRKVVDLNQIIARVEAQYRGKHEVIAVERGASMVEVNCEALEQALVHLVQNAIDASDEKSPVFIDLRQEPGCAIIEVVDSGCGMSPEYIRTRLFKPFHSSKAGGFGIGAFEARELIRSMNGRLDVESREGLGTRFIVRLPTSEARSLIRSMQDQQSPDNATKVA